MASRYITNLFACTAARAVGEDSESEDEHQHQEEVQNKEGHAGSLALITKTLQGIASLEEKKGDIILGRHGKAIQLGRAQWETKPLTRTEEKHVHEVCFNDVMSPHYTNFPSAKDARNKATKMVKQIDPRPAPYANADISSTKITHKDIGK